MAATTTDELLMVANKEFDKLAKLLDQVEPELALVKDDDDTSIKDIIGHRAHWIDLYFGWYEDGLAGQEVFFPAEGYKWNDLKRYNADLRRAQAGLGWEPTKALLVEANDRLMHFITESCDADLYGGPMIGAKNDWTPGRWAEAAGPSHYRSAAKYIRGRLRGS
ncbi:MAG: ClbS/DfsB family four-helix bundle protein [Acidimicrobiales bacterium]